MWFRHWKWVSVSLLSTALCLAVIGQVSAWQLLRVINRTPNLEIQTGRWSGYLLGFVDLEDAQLREETKPNALLEGSFHISYQPLSLWLGKDLNLRIQGRSLSLDWLRALIRHDQIGVSLIEGGEADITIRPGGEIDIRRGRMYGQAGVITFNGQITRTGTLGIKSIMRFDPNAAEMLERWFNPVKVRTEVPGSAAGRIGVTEITCVMEGTVAHPHFTFSSELFQLEFG